MAEPSTRWGYERTVWDASRAQLIAALVECAVLRTTASYSQLCESITAGRFRPYSWSFMALLDEACREEDARTGAILASLAVRKDTGRPGEGYFHWAEKSGLLGVDREAFWLNAAECVWSAYAPTALGDGASGSCHTEAL